MPSSTGAMRASEKSPTAVRQRVLLSRLSPCRSTPITTTGGLPFCIKVAADNGVRVCLAG